MNSENLKNNNSNDSNIQSSEANNQTSDVNNNSEVVVLSMNNSLKEPTSFHQQMFHDRQTNTWTTSFKSTKEVPVSQLANSGIDDQVPLYSSENPNLTHAFTISLKMGQNGFDTIHLPNPIQERMSREEYESKIHHINELWKGTPREGVSTHLANKNVSRWAFFMITSFLCLLGCFLIFISMFVIFWIFFGITTSNKIHIIDILSYVFGILWVLACFGIIFCTILSIFSYSVFNKWLNVSNDEKMRDKLILMSHYLDRHNESSLFNHGIAWRLKMPPSSQIAHAGWSKFAKPGLEILVFDSKEKMWGTNQVSQSH